MTRTQIFAVVVPIVLGASALHMQATQQPGTRRTELQRHDLGVPGREFVQARIELDPGVEFGRHWHPGEEIVYVLEGSLVYELEGRQPIRLHAGEVLFIPARTVHAAKNDGKSIGAELATYIVEKGKPLVMLVGYGR
jgi:quercetin dioxygenase-like cupin family protein